MRTSDEVQSERQLLTVEEVSRLLGKSLKDTYKAARSVPGFVKFRRSVRFRRGPLMRWLEDADPDERA